VRLVDCTGYIASLLVFLTFAMKDMVPLRVVALFSNVAFLVYGGALQLWPVVLLHGALIPINIWRLAAEFRTPKTAQAAKAAPPSSPSRSRRAA
jgi:CRP/FNR family cyclic AMP-dependent transcriptional regulator